jgi:gamma-glutamyl hydrolase
LIAFGSALAIGVRPVADRQGTQTLNNTPIIGILTQPYSGESPAGLPSSGLSYIAASYVKYIESGGARVVPIFYNLSTSDLDHIFDSINGIMFPGGGSDIEGTPLYLAAKHLYNRALQAFDNGDYFPILGHCMGFEILATITSGDDYAILTEFDAENISLSLNFTAAAKGSKWLGNAPSDVIDILASQSVTMNNHMYGVSPADYQANQNLVDFYSILSTNNDREGKEFISLWEGRKYPIFGSQWHAEKNQFEWYAGEVINHTPDAIYAMTYFSRFIANQARLNNHHFKDSQEEYNRLIYNYPAFYSESYDPGFEQIYLF